MSIQNDINSVKAKIEQVQVKIEEKQKELDSFEVSRDEDDYEECLNDSCGTVYVCGVTFDAGYALRNLDPTAFRIGMGEWVNSLDPSDEDGYKDLEYELEELTNELFDLEDELEGLLIDLEDEQAEQED